MRFTILLLSLFIPFTSYSQVLINHANVLDVEAKKLLPDQTLLIQDGRITAMAQGLRFKLPESTTVIDATGKYIVPGYIDGHVHFFQSGGLYTRPDGIDLRKYRPYAKEITWSKDNMEMLLRRYLSAGITSVVDVGATVNFLAQRDSFRNKPYAPAVYMTGPLLTTYEPEVFKGLGNDEPFWLMKTEADARRYVQQQLAYKPDFIKIWYIVLSKNVDSGARASLPMVKAVIDEAHKAGLRVAVHATERITARLSVEAGADYLVHSVEDSPVDAGFVQLLKQKGTVLCPTLLVGGNYTKTFAWQYRPSQADRKYAPAEPLRSLFDLPHLKDSAFTRLYRNYGLSQLKADSQMLVLMRSNLKKLVDGGVTIAAGTDAGNIGTQHVASFFDELKAMQDAGLTSWQLLQAATINGARAVGKQEQTGSVKKGKDADLLILKANPLDSPAAWESIEWIIHKGIVSKPDSIRANSPLDAVEQQLAGYNAHDLELFLAPYADDVELYGLSGRQLAKGKETMRKMYGFVNAVPDLHCEIVDRITEGNTIVDHEKITYNGHVSYGLAVYITEGGKIKKVYFGE